MTIVKELNELAYKMTGVNPKAKTDQQALNYIEQHYQGGQPSPTPTSKFDYVIPLITAYGYTATRTIDEQDAISVLDEIFSDENNEAVIGLHLYQDSDENYHFLKIIDIKYYENEKQQLRAICNDGTPYEVNIYKSGTSYYIATKEI